MVGNLSTHTQVNSYLILLVDRIDQKANSWLLDLLCLLSIRLFQLQILNPLPAMLETHCRKKACLSKEFPFFKNKMEIYHIENKGFLYFSKMLSTLPKTNLNYLCHFFLSLLFSIDFNFGYAKILSKKKIDLGIVLYYYKTNYENSIFF